MRTSIATVCISGGLTEKLIACAAAGFDGVEIMDADLTAAFESPEEIRALCNRLGLTIYMYQPIRDIEGVSPEVFADNLRRARAKFELMQRLGTDLILMCSNVGTATINDDAVVVEQLRQVADLAAEYRIRIAYEALAWGRFVNDYREAWRLVELADRANLGVCLDSFHVLARGHDPAAIEEIPGERIFFLQLADAPALDMDVLSLSRHHRLFPGEGAFDLSTFLGHVFKSGYIGPLSLEVFNDTFRQTDTTRTAKHALRSLRVLADHTAVLNNWSTGLLSPPQPPQGFDFVEVSGSDLSEVEVVLDQLGFGFAGSHRSKNVRLWHAGDARIIINEQVRHDDVQLTGFGLIVADPAAASRRAHEIGATRVFRRSSAGEQELYAVAGPDGTASYWTDAAGSAAWQSEFGAANTQQHAEEGASPALRSGVIDHLNVAVSWEDFDEATLFNANVLALDPVAMAEVPGPTGLVGSKVMRTEDGSVRLAVNVAPPTAEALPRHVAVRVDDAVSVARIAQERGLQPLPVPDNYYDDVAARFQIDPAELAELRTLGLLYDRDEHGTFVHFYTPTIDGFFLEIVERRSSGAGAESYDGFGASNTPVRLTAQRAFAAK